MTAKVHPCQEDGMDTQEPEIWPNEQSCKTITNMFQIHPLVLRGNGEIEKGKKGKKRQRYGL